MTNVRARIALLVLIFTVCFVPIAFGQSDYKVVEIVVEGNKVASRSLILGVSAIDLGSPLSPTASSETISRLYALGIFTEIQIDAEIVTGGIKVYIIVKELPKLTALEFNGNKKVNTDELKDKLNLGIGGYISPYLANKKKNDILDIYAAQGYFQAEVNSETIFSDDSTTATLRFTINEKSKVKVEKVFLTGVERVEPNEIIKKMRNRKRGFLKSSDFAKDKYEEDLEKIITEFHKKGYIDAYLISDSSTIDTTTNRMKIYLHVYEGPQYYFGKATFTHLEEMPEKYLKKKIEYREGDIFDMEKYQNSISEIYSAYYDIGHLHIRLLDERTTRDDSLIDVNYDITEGLPSKINLVTIVGNTKTKDKVIRRELSTLPGQKFNRELLIRSVRNAMALNFFTNVNPVPLDLPNGDVNVEFQVEEKQTAQASAGAGYNSQDGIVGNLGIGIPNFRGMGQNLSFNTDFGSSRNSFSISFTEPWLNGRPTLFGTDIYSTKRQWFDDYTESKQGASIRLGKRLRWPDSYFRVFASYRLERDRYEDFSDNFIFSQSYKDFHSFETFSDLGRDTTYTDATETEIDTITVRYDFLGTIYDTTATAKDPIQPFPNSILNYDEQWNTASRFSFTITRDSRNLPEFATSGSKFLYSIEKTGGVLGGFWEYTKHKISYAKFFPIYKSISLAVRTQFGAVIEPYSFRKDDNSRHTLLSDRFTPGGVAYDGIIRGYDDGSITPDTLIPAGADTIYFYNSETDSAMIISRDLDPAFADSSEINQTDGGYTRVRGNFMLVSNIELQVPIVSQSIYGILFFDAGNSWLDFTDIQLFTRPKIYSSGGVGFRVAVPGIGTIGFDFAKPFSNIRDQENGWRTHFQIGTTFK